jgi:hypothetical protein
MGGLVITQYVCTYMYETERELADNHGFMGSGNRLGNKREKHIDSSQLIATKGFAKQLQKKEKQKQA